jgi:spore germination protein GerM
MDHQKLNWKGIFLLVTILLLAGFSSWYLMKSGQPNEVNKAKENAVRENREPEVKKIILYFGDQNAMSLIPEERQVVVEGKSLETIVIEELIKGPQNPQLTRTIPEETELISVEVTNGVAYVNFSRELQTKHWGGSAGEQITLYSVTNSLAKLPGIEKVQFLLEGEKKESILGHVDTSQPLEPNWDLVKE